jgi:hypothetical protein
MIDIAPEPDDWTSERRHRGPALRRDVYHAVRIDRRDQHDLTEQRRG